jgi:mycobactin lysine-N-oxygenase
MDILGAKESLRGNLESPMSVSIPSKRHLRIARMEIFDMRIVVVGCGPKALAIYAKAKGLKEAGFKVPEICIIEKSDIAANWTGDRYGFTDGDQPLGTPPEKDIGFPYNSEYKNWRAPRAAEIDQILFRYSWPSYKIACRQYADWLDRGRPAPRHAGWSDYLKWVAENLELQFKPGGSLRRGTLDKVRTENGRWVVRYMPHESESPPEEIHCDSIVVTGPGSPKRILGQASDDALILDGESFWRSEKITYFRFHYRERPAKFAVIGAGETAATITSALWKMFGSKDWVIDIISPRGTLYTRGEGYHENRYFSDPKDWHGLHINLRKELIERTDRGVLSRKAMELITEAQNVHFIQGEVDRISLTGKKVRVGLKKIAEDEADTGKHDEINGGGEQRTEDYDCVIVALGFDALSFHSWFSASDLGPVLCNAAAEHRNRDFFAKCVKTITADLSVSNLQPKLYLPMLASLMQGPGFPNLSCLGSLSDRILKHSMQKLNPKLSPEVKRV